MINHRLLTMIICVLLNASAYAGQIEEQPVIWQPIADQNSLQSLEALQRALRSKEMELISAQTQLETERDEMTSEELRRQISTLRNQIDESRRQFEAFAVDIDLSLFSASKEQGKFDWQEKLGKLIEPIIAEVENATKEARVIGNLRAKLEEVVRRRNLAEKAVSNLDLLLGQPASPELQERLHNRREIWRRTLEQTQHEVMALDLQLQTRLTARKSLLDQSIRFFRDFVQRRGLNLLMGIFAFCVIFFGFRFAEFLLHRVKGRSRTKTFQSRIMALLFHAFSILGGLLAMMGVFSLVGDWFLLGIIVIFLLGVGWASINTLPQQIETIKLILNIGAVREGELLIYEGLPYHVETLGFIAKLKNPLLNGGQRKMPAKYLVGMSSRQRGENEPWFPAKTNDWVELSDGVFGRITNQSPVSVTLTEPGEATRIYPTNSFLQLNPKNLSSGFRVETTFGVDYKHQAIATEQIPKQMETKITAQLGNFTSQENIVNIRVSFASAGASSLDYTVQADFKGEAAPQARILRRAIQRILTDACNEHGWTIPFAQLTVHRAE